MADIVIGSFTFLAVFGGALIGIGLSRLLPQPHLSQETRNAVSVSMAVVGTLAALVLGLMLSTASSVFSTRALAVETLAIDIVRLDRILRHAGPEASDVRNELRRYTDAKIAELTGPDTAEELATGALSIFETINDHVNRLEADDRDGHHALTGASGLLDAISDARWRLVENASVTIPPAFLVLVVFWLALLFASFGLFAPNNLTVLVALLLCALAISAGIYMILELGAPTRGIIRVPVAPLLAAGKELNMPD